MTTSNSDRSGGGSFQRQRSANDLRQRFEWLSRFDDNELQEISLCNEGAPLQDGAEYFDISHPERGIIVGERGKAAPEGSCYVWRGSVSQQTWKKLLDFGGERQAGR